MKTSKFQIVIFTSLIIILTCGNVYAQSKREFRGAWVQCVNGQFTGLSTHAMQSSLTHQLNELQKDGVNAIIFQVRPECDALYESSFEPWSRFLTGTQGVSPSPYWDPLKWMVEQCHKRGMEIHAWINPYRAKTKGTNNLSRNHVVIRHPEWVFEYDGQFILNPGIPECREYICKIVNDIVKRYDVDGLHIDDYFYPYPVAGQKIDDERQFKQNNNGIKNIGDWRRYNVNVFIKQMHDSITSVKPWVKFGVSPFGIYRNKKTSPIGSETNGLQNYDDLYADVLMWVNNGWIDYVVPQLYWEIGHKAADYETLIKWWNTHITKRPLYIGEDIERTVKKADLKNPNINQMPAKFKLHSEMRNVKGTVLWYSKAAVDNVGNYGITLRNHYWKFPALQPLMPFIDGNAPKKVRKMKVIDTPDGSVLFWTAPKGKSWEDKAVKYVVYKFSNGERINIGDPSKIVAITTNNFYNIIETGRATYVVTALDRVGNESKGKKKKI
ncbi:glycoside hydrolase family 10 protein [Prevotella sp. OH937_COT-195]|uniref:glycoside hydrolase family 10 protein n=1 Tax=Prevotella sp. OH937_COT-195 TaxID=2491051 RepID=UPI000F65060E|nr:family 10 glycosylhydrolase [Prevotella sp. OH937_COT-195]RRD02247.1 hypothetical protein EII32_04180 [Prevotella sp. OH937_COT-195]